MRTFIEFLKTTIIGGFFVLLPVVVVLLLISLAVATVVEALTPLLEVLPIKGVGDSPSSPWRPSYSFSFFVF